MNEREFAKYILDAAKDNKTIGQWYTNFMENTPFVDTELRIKYAIENNELKITEAIILALFIGLSTQNDIT